MSTLVGTECDLTVLQGNDESIPFTISDGASAYNLTGVTLAFYLKASNQVADNTGYTNTPVIGSYPALGQFTVAIPNAQLATSGAMFYHVDATDGGLVTTLVYGEVNILPV